MVTRDRSAAARGFLQRHKPRVSMASSFFLILIPWMKFSQKRSQLLGLSLLTWVVLLAVDQAHALDEPRGADALERRRVEQLAERRPLV